MQMVICRGLSFGHVLLNIHEDSERYLSVPALASTTFWDSPPMHISGTSLKKFQTFQNQLVWLFSEMAELLGGSFSGFFSMKQ